jgi:hypothetical protein
MQIVALLLTSAENSTKQEIKLFELSFAAAAHAVDERRMM